MNIFTFTSNPFQVNTYVVVNSRNEAVIIDPGCSTKAEQEHFVSALDKLSVTPAMIILTHAHVDHILGCGFLREKYNISVYAHADSQYFIDEAPDSARLFGLSLTHPPFIDNFLKDGDQCGIDQVSFDVLHTPGHAAGSICLYSSDSQLLITGDVLFQNSIGRTDLPTGNMELLLKSIYSKLMSLPDNTVVYPGHGPSTTIGDEREFNPFLAL
jgi:hydroxyacylglutathione hydrolase